MPPARMCGQMIASNKNGKGYVQLPNGDLLLCEYN